MTTKEYNQGLNTCDICNAKQLSTELIWLSEDFQPKPTEAIRWQFIELGNVQAVCEQCYLSECLEDKELLK
jgi:hypothetical protein